jgi:hypothetical protein
MTASFDPVEAKDYFVVDVFAVRDDVALHYPPLDVHVELVDHLSNEG